LDWAAIVDYKHQLGISCSRSSLSNKFGLLKLLFDYRII